MKGETLYVHGKYAPDPSVHDSPELEKRCPYCHPEIKAAKVKKEPADALGADRKRPLGSEWDRILGTGYLASSATSNYVPAPQRLPSMAELFAQKAQLAQRQAVQQYAQQQYNAAAEQAFGGLTREQFANGIKPSSWTHDGHRYRVDDKGRVRGDD